MARVASAGIARACSKTAAVVIGVVFGSLRPHVSAIARLSIVVGARAAARSAVAYGVEAGSVPVHGMTMRRPMMGAFSRGGATAAVDFAGIASTVLSGVGRSGIGDGTWLRPGRIGGRPERRRTAPRN